MKLEKIIYIMLGVFILLTVIILVSMYMKKSSIKNTVNGSTTGGGRIIGGGTACQSISYNSDGTLKSSCWGYTAVDKDGYTYCKCGSEGSLNA